jgi:hypothetical protein
MYRRGDLFESEADARAAYRFALELRWPMGRPAILAQLVTALIERGELEEAEAALADSGLSAPAPELSQLYTSNLLLFARGRLLAAGDPGLALDDLLECGRREEAWQHNPALIRGARRRQSHTTRSASQRTPAGLRRRSWARPPLRRVPCHRDGAAALVTHGDDGLELARESVTVLADSPGPTRARTGARRPRTEAACGRAPRRSAPGAARRARTLPRLWRHRPRAAPAARAVPALNYRRRQPPSGRTLPSRRDHRRERYRLTPAPLDERSRSPLSPKNAPASSLETEASN